MKEDKILLGGLLSLAVIFFLFLVFTVTNKQEMAIVIIYLVLGAIVTIFLRNKK